MTMGSDSTNLDQFYNYDKIALVSKSNQDKTFGELERAFNAADYKASIPLVNQLLTSDPQNPELLLTKGISEMENGNIENALQSFAQLKAAGLRIDKSDWFSALAYLKQGKKTEAKTLLQKIVNTKAYNNKKAQEVLDVLGN